MYVHPTPSPCPGSTGASFSDPTKRDARIKSGRSEWFEVSGAPPPSQPSFRRKPESRFALASGEGARRGG